MPDVFVSEGISVRCECYHSIDVICCW